MYEVPAWEVTVCSNDNVKTQYKTTKSPNPNLDSELIAKQLAAMKNQIKELENALQKTSDQKPEVFSTSFSHQEGTKFKHFSVTKYKRFKKAIDEETIDFYKNNYGSPSFISQGPLSWVALLKKDIYLKAIFLSIKNKSTILLDQAVNRSDKEFATKFANEIDIKAKLRKDSKAEDELSTVKRNIASVKSKNSYLVFFPSGKKDFIGSLNRALKDRRKVWRFFDEFFNSELYCAVPIFNKGELESQLLKILGPRGEPTERLALKLKAELATVGSIMLIMRLVTISIYNGGYKFDPETATPNELFIYENEVSKDIAELIKMCAKELAIFRETSIPIFQFQLLFKLYMLISPENYGILNAPSSSVMGSILDSAIANGLNRDPEIVGSSYPLPNLLRRIWTYFIFSDYQQIMLIGSPPIISSRFYDTAMPELGNDVHSIEYKIDEGFIKSKELVDLTSDLLKLVLNIRQPPKFKVVKDHLKPLEEFVFKHLSFDDLVKAPSRTVAERFEKQTFFFKVFDSALLLSTFYHHFFLFYNEHEDVEGSVYYLCQLLKLGKFLYQVSTFVNPTKNPELNLQKEFGKSFSAVHKIQLGAHRAATMGFTILARIKSLKAFSSNLNPEVTNVIDQIVVVGKRLLSLCYTNSGFLADTYYQSWAIFKIHRFISEQILPMPFDDNEDSEFSTSFMEILTQLREHDQIFNGYSAAQFSQVLELLKLFDPELSMIGKSSRNSITTQNEANSKPGFTINNILNQPEGQEVGKVGTATEIDSEIEQGLKDISEFNFSAGDRIWMDQYLTNAKYNEKFSEVNLDKYYTDQMSNASSGSPNDVPLNNELNDNSNWGELSLPMNGVIFTTDIGIL